MKQVLVYENSDGYLTKELGVYKRREKILNKIKKSVKDGLTTVFLSLELKEASTLSDKQWKEQNKRKKIDKLYNFWRKQEANLCSNCGGYGEIEYTDCSNAQTTMSYDCRLCGGDGLNSEAKEKFQSNKWIKEARKMKK